MLLLKCVSQTGLPTFVFYEKAERWLQQNKQIETFQFFCKHLSNQIDKVGNTVTALKERWRPNLHFVFFFFDRFTKTSSIGIAVKCQCQEPRQRQPNRLVGSKRTTWPSFSWASSWYSSYVTLLGTSSASSRWSSSKRPWNAKPWTCTHFPYGRCIPHLLGKKNNLTVKKN